MLQICTVCTSPYRKYIEKGHKRNVSSKVLAHNFFPFFNKLGVSASEQSLYVILCKHFRKKHPPSLKDLKIPMSPEMRKEIEDMEKKAEAIELPDLFGEEEQVEEQEEEEIPQPIEEEKAPQTMDDYAKRLLQLGFTKEMLDKATPSMIIQAQKMLIEQEKINNQNNVYLQVLKKMMAGTVTQEDIQKLEGAMPHEQAILA